MKTILVDDMLLDLQLFELKCADMPDFEIVGKFTDPNAAIEYAAGHVVDFALLDIDMPGMDGIHLAQALRRPRSDIIIVFATAHPKFAVEALKMKADYIIFKPFDREDIADVMERASRCAAASASASISTPSGPSTCWWTASRCTSAPARPRS